MSAIRIDATFDPTLLARIDRAAREDGMSRSALLAQGAREWLEHREQRQRQHAELLARLQSAEMALRQGAA